MKKVMSKKGGAAKPAAGFLPAVDASIRELKDWRGETLGRLRTLIHEAVPDVVETMKWDVPVWECDGIICTGETYKGKVKLTFAKGASVEDPSGLFNSSLEGRVRRAIDFAENDRIDQKAFKALVRAAAALNASKTKKTTPARKTSKRG